MSDYGRVDRAEVQELWLKRASLTPLEVRLLHELGWQHIAMKECAGELDESRSYAEELTRAAQYAIDHGDHSRTEAVAWLRAALAKNPREARQATPGACAGDQRDEGTPSGGTEKPLGQNALSVSGIPEGWALVPRKLTPEMCRALGYTENLGEHVYKDLLAAAPVIPECCCRSYGWRCINASSVEPYRCAGLTPPSQGLDLIPEGETPADARMLRAANHTLAGEVHEAVEIIRDLVRQINEFAEQHGEADFFTGKAAALLQGYDTVSEEHICGAADDAGEGPCPLCQSQTVQGRCRKCGATASPCHCKSAD